MTSGERDITPELRIVTIGEMASAESEQRAAMTARKQIWHALQGIPDIEEPISRTIPTKGGNLHVALSAGLTDRTSLRLCASEEDGQGTITPLFDRSITAANGTSTVVDTAMNTEVTNPLALRTTASFLEVALLAWLSPTDQQAQE